MQRRSGCWAAVISPGVDLRAQRQSEEVEMRRTAVPAGALAALALALAACGATGAAAPAVPSLGTVTGTTTGGQGTQGKAALVHAAADCIRQHGIPGYQEPVLTPDGQVYSDTRSIQEAPQSVQDAADHACHALVTRAG